MHPAGVDAVEPYVECDDVVVIAERDGKRHDRAIGDGIGVCVGVADSIGVCDGVLIPVRCGEVVGLVTLPRVCGDDFSVDHGVWVDDVISEDPVDVVGVVAQPLVHGFFG